MLLPSVTILTVLLASAGVVGNPVAAPGPIPAPSLKDTVIRRAANCTFSGSIGYSLASKSKTSCSTIVLSSLTVPSGVTLNLEKLNTGTNVRYTNFVLGGCNRI